MSGPATKGWAIAAVLAALAACSDDTSTTDLNPDGPPMVRQVFMKEKVVVGEQVRIRNALAFGTHADLPTEFNTDDGTVTNALAKGDQQIRIVLDELLLGNTLEEMACDDGTYSQVPVGTDPDDVKRCAGADLSDCTTVCIGTDGPIGILDENEDGAADDFRLIEYDDGEYGVNLVCGGVNMPINLTSSFYNPSGNQLIPAGDAGHNGLGPAIILVPSQGMRTGGECTIAFRDEVTDKDGNQVCAPPNGNIDEACPSDGSTDLITFNVEPLALAGSEPVEGSTTVDPVDEGFIILIFNALLDPATIGAISLSDGADVPITVSLSADDPAIVNVLVPGGLAPDTDYVLTATTELTDIFGGALPEPATLTFSTSGGTPGPDAGVPDAML